MPNKNTFDIKPIHDLIIEELTDGLWIDPFANKNKLATVTNDLSKEFDPPYSPRQVSECYNNVGYNVTWDTTKASFWGNHKREISRIVKLGGKVITFGWHNDTKCTIKTK